MSGTPWQNNGGNGRSSKKRPSGVGTQSASSLPPGRPNGKPSETPWRPIENVLANERNALAEQRRQWQAEQEEAQRRWDAERQQFAAQQAEWKTERNALAAERNVLQDERNALAEERRQWQTEQEEAQRRWDAERQQFAAQQAELEMERVALAAERQQWEQRRDESATRVEPLAKTSETAAEAESSAAPAEQELQFEEPVQQAPVDLADVLRRVGAKLDLPEEETNQRRTLPAEAEEQGTGPISAQHPHGGEESIDDYMSRLMQRVRSTAGEASATGVGVESPKPSKPPAAASSPTVEVKPQEPASAPPRTVAPEKRTDLSALRELANLAAHSAISHHSQRVLKNNMYSKLVIASAALVMGGGLLWMWELYGAWQMALYAAVVAFPVGAYWGVEYAFLTRRITGTAIRAAATRDTAETASRPKEQASDEG